MGAVSVIIVFNAGTKALATTSEPSELLLKQAEASMAVETRSLETGGRLYTLKSATKVIDADSGCSTCKECINWRAIGREVMGNPYFEWLLKTCSARSGQ